MKASLVCFAAALALSNVASAKTYQVAFDGNAIDLTGQIEFDATGSFDLATFSSMVGAFSITASENGASAYTFTELNSTWGRPGLYGTAVSVDVTESTITMSAPTPGMGVNDGINIFLIAQTPTNGALENLKMYGDALYYRQPAPSSLSAWEPLPGYQFTATASTVPEPATALMLGLGLMALMGATQWDTRRRLRAVETPAA